MTAFKQTGPISKIADLWLVSSDIRSQSETSVVTVHCSVDH